MNTYNIIAVIRLYNLERTTIINEVFLTKTGTLYEYRNNTLELITKVYDITGKELLELYRDDTSEYYSSKFGIVEIDDKSISKVLDKYGLIGKLV